jgi:photosystem II stability/assembly factor-like uncharacterized protein
MGGNMNFKKNILFFFLLATSLFSQSGWSVLTSGTSENLNSVLFNDSNYGFIVGANGTLLSTIDGGKNWFKQSSGTSNNISLISFVDSKNGFIWGSNKTFIKTQNGGNTWLNFTDSVKNGFVPSAFLDINNALAITQSSDTTKIYKSIDGGKTWQYLSRIIMSFFSPYRVFYKDSNNILIVGSIMASGTVFYSTDGGKTWKQGLSTGGASSGGFKKVSFCDSQNGIFMAYAGMTSQYWSYLYKTTNGGVSWQSLPTYQLPQCQSIFMINNNFAFAVGNNQAYLGTAIPNAIYKTTDGCLTWNMQISNTAKKLNDVYFTDLNNGIVVGDNGTILRTTTGGLVGIDTKHNDLPDKFSLEQNYPNPFNPETTIKYTIPKSSFVTLKVFDLLGREIATLVDEYKQSGKHSIEFSISQLSDRSQSAKADKLSSGIYFYTLQAGNFIQTKKMMLMK